MYSHVKIITVRVCTLTHVFVGGQLGLYTNKKYIYKSGYILHTGPLMQDILLHVCLLTMSSTAGRHV